MSNLIQQEKYLSARAGKAAVGVFSLDMVLNSSLQFIEEPVNFYNIEDNKIEAINPRKGRIINLYLIL